MARFAYEAIASNGRVRGVLMASDVRELDARLAHQGLVLLRSRPERRAARATARTRIDLLYQLSAVIGAGISLPQALRELQEEGAHPLAEELDAIERRISSGSSLSEAASRHPEHFPPIAIAVIRAGEETGQLDVALRDLVSYFEWREELGRQVRKATLYPSMLLCVLAVFIGILFAFVLPRFVSIFDAIGVPVPGPMAFVLGLREALIDFWPLALLLAGGLVSGATAALRTEAGRDFRDEQILRLPVVGGLALAIDVSRFCHNLGLLYAAGLPILHAQRLTAEIVQNRTIRRAILEGAERVQQGAGLVDSLRGAGVFPSMVLRMLQVGEASGRLDESLERVAGFYEREVPLVIERVTGWFNTGVLLLLAALVVTIALTFFVPLYQGLGALNAG